MNPQPKIDEKKWRRFSRIADCVLTIIAVIISYIIGEAWFGGSFVATLIIVVIATILFTALGQLILSFISKSNTLRKPFEQKNDEQSAE